MVVISPGPMGIPASALLPEFAPRPFGWAAAGRLVRQSLEGGLVLMIVTTTAVDADSPASSLAIQVHFLDPYRDLPDDAFEADPSLETVRELTRGVLRWAGYEFEVRWDVDPVRFARHFTCEPDARHGPLSRKP